MARAQTNLGPSSQPTQTHATHDAHKHTNAYSTVPSDRYQGAFAARKLLEKGVNVTVLAYGDSSYGQSLNFAFTAAYTRDGGRVYSVPFPQRDHNLTETADKVMAEVAARKAGGLFVVTTYAPANAALIKAAKAAARKVTIFLADGGMDPAVAEAAGPSVAAGVRGSDVAFGDPAFVERFKAFAKKRKRAVSYVSYASHAYDAAAALIEAYRRAQDPKSGADVIAELAGVKIAKGKAGVPIAFDEYGDLQYDPSNSYTVGEFQPDGQLRSLGPDATA